jgi:hypothetical protein
MIRSAIAAAAVLALAGQAHAHELVKKWETPAELAVPESVCIDHARNVLYTSNIDGEPWGDDKKGSIGKVSMDGKILAAEWVTGLSAPKGLALVGNLLYVGDMKEVVVIDVDKAAIVKRIAMPGAQGLNDVGAGPDGTVYVSDSYGKKLFRIRNDQPEVLLENLDGPNGVVWHDGSLYLLDRGSALKVGADRSLTPITSGIEGVIDGIEPVSAREFLVSTWQGTVMLVKADGSREMLLDTRDDKINAADIAYDAKKRIVYVPTFFHKTIAAYELK